MADALREALGNLLDFCWPRPGEGFTAYVDRLAEDFYRETRVMAPGKSVPLPMEGAWTDEERRERYSAWAEDRSAQLRNAARAALASAPSGEQPAESAKERWGISDDEERFDGDWATKEEAIAAAPAELNLEPGQRFWVGRAVSYDPMGIWADRVLDDLKSNADDEVGELAEDWLSNVASADETRLEEELEKVVKVWLRETGHWPEFFTCDYMEEHTVPATLSSEGNDRG